MRYEEVIDDELLREQFSRVIRKLKSYDCIAADGKASGMTYRTAETSSGIPETVHH